MQTPGPLRPGDAIRIIAPSGAFARDSFEAGISCLKEAGYVPRYDEHIFSRSRYLAGTDQRRLAELRDALCEQDTKAIWVARGGYGATRIVPQLETRLVAEAGKWLVGFSDVTALHCQWSRAGVQSIHGANITTLSSWSGDARTELFAQLEGSAQQRLTAEHAMGHGVVDGHVMGGNLTVLAAMAGTGYLPNLSGAIVVLEDVGERPYRLDRSLTQLIQSGSFGGAAGFVVGQLTGCGPVDPDEADYTATDIVTTLLGHLGVPILTGLSLGHEKTSRAITLGRLARLDPKTQTLTMVDGRVDGAASEVRSTDVGKYA